MTDKVKNNSWKNIDDSKKSKIFNYSNDYKLFLEECKTVRESINYIERNAIENGFEDIERKYELKKGDKVYFKKTNESIFLAIIGKENLNLIISHVDSPRLDLKPKPLVEKNGLAFFKTHYYGGIKKYQWVNIPLDLRGVIITDKGKIEVHEEVDFTISDLLIHLSKNQLNKKAKKVIDGENMNVILGNMPNNGSIKENILYHLKTKYDVLEEDLITSDLNLVPKFKPNDVGFDKSMIGGYGHDDRSCVYNSYNAIINAKNNFSTNIAMFVDKEEVGSDGNSGAKSRQIEYFLEMIIKKAQWSKSINELLINTNAVSGDVTSAYDPFYSNSYDPTNTCFLGNGAAIEKYTGSHGKASTNEANAEYFYLFKKLAKDNKINWQTGEIGKVDLGGGGTVAKFLAKLGMNIIDIGIPVLGMHSPYEIISKLDLYECFRLYREFYNNF
ncbi:MAG: aminopeptidase [Candidatus Woesearchaeota archaeon]